MLVIHVCVKRKFSIIFHAVIKGCLCAMYAYRLKAQEARNSFHHRGAAAAFLKHKRETIYIAANVITMPIFSTKIPEYVYIHIYVEVDTDQPT